MKRILIDLYKIKDMYSGLGHFSKNYANELIAQLPSDYEVDFLIPSKTNPSLCANNSRLIKATYRRKFLPFLNKDYFIWHSLQQFPSYLPNKNTTWILTIHDLNFLIEKNEKKQKKYISRLQKFVDRADYITAISYFTKKQLENNINLNSKKITVIHNGIKSGENVKNLKPNFLKNGKFLFTIGVFQHKKNFACLVPLMKYLKDYQLIIAGNNESDYGEEIKKQIKNLNLEDRIILPGKISESNKQWLYIHCEAFLFPTLAEGFGMPVIEAMYHGKPVFLSKHTSLPEIGGSTAFYFDNFEQQHMYNVISDKLKFVHQNKKQFTRQLINHAKQFNWTNCMKQYINFYKEVEESSSKN